MSRGPVIGTIFAWWYQRGDGESMAATVNLFGMRATRTLQQGLGFIRSSITWRSSGAPSQQPWKQAPRGLLASKPNYFQFNRSELCSQGSAITFEGEDAQEANDSVTEELELGEQEWCLEEPKACLTHADYLSFTDKSLLAQCVVDTYRASGAGGQHRNKTDSAVRLKHSPTGLVGQAADDRSQHVNKALALNRLRQVIAIKVRRPVDLNNYEPSPELLRILPAASTIKREKGVGQQIGPKNSSYVNGMQTLLDLLCALNGSVSEAAPRLGLSTGMLSKLITSDRTLWQAVNAVRALKGLKPLR